MCYYRNYGGCAGCLFSLYVYKVFLSEEWTTLALHIERTTRHNLDWFVLQNSSDAIQ